MVAKDFIIKEVQTGETITLYKDGSSIVVFYENDETTGYVNLNTKGEVKALISELKLLSKNME